jgi:WD40 repeat protein
MAVLVDCIVTVSEVCLSPQMDILALLTLDGTLMVNRTTSWQCLLAPTDAVAAGAISALCWSPDGRQLALGHRRGGLSILDVEAGALVSRTCYSDHMVHNSCISLMFWARQVTAKGTGGLSRPRRTAPNCSKAPILQRPRLRVRWPNSTHSTCHWR